MNLLPTSLPSVLLIEPKVFGDSRGWFFESFSEKELVKFGINTVFIQDNHSYTARKGTLRGLHFQNPPMAQTKLIRCTRGAIFDVAVDIRRGSINYLCWTGVELTAENKYQLYIPKGFAHGFLTLTDDVEVQYKVDVYYSPAYDRSIKFNDPMIGVDWGVSNPLLSDKDDKAPLIADSDAAFTYSKEEERI